MVGAGEDGDAERSQKGGVVSKEKGGDDLESGENWKKDMNGDAALGKNEDEGEGQENENDDDDEDIPLLELKKNSNSEKKGKVKEKEEKQDEKQDEEEEEDEDEDVPLTALAKKNTKAKKAPPKGKRKKATPREAIKKEVAVEEEEIDDENDDDDDDEDEKSIPKEFVQEYDIATTSRRNRRKRRVNYTEEGAEDDSDSDEDDSPVEPRRRTKRNRDDVNTSPTRKKLKSLQAAEAQSTVKHELAGEILKRWQYCLPPWPGEVAKPERGYVECGIPGIHVGIAPEVLGEIKDVRDRSGKAPILNVLLKFPTSELKEDLIKGIEKQMAILNENAKVNPTSWVEEVTAELQEDLKAARQFSVSAIDSEFRSWAKENDFAMN